MENTIIICEKPDSCARIANALAESNLIRRRSKYGVDYYEFFRDGKNFIAVCAVGHLFNLKQKGKVTYPTFDAEWLPSCMSVKKAFFTLKYFDTLEYIAQRNTDSELISATDFDNEGSLIASNIIRFIFNKDDGKRMKFSTLTKQDLVNAYNNMMPHLDFNNILAGETRHYLDWIYGINTSRALTLSVKKMSKRFSLLTAGRVQAPMLVILADRETEIKNFIPVPFWQLQLTLLASGRELIALYEEDKIWEKERADKIFNECNGKPAIVDSVIKKRHIQPPPFPFNITSLQMESYRLFGFSPQYTMKIAQKLYTSAYISYPRTSSEKIPPQLGYRQILESLSKIKKYENLCKKLLQLPELKPAEGSKVDSAHYAIVPTQEPPKDISRLSPYEQKIYDLICKRFFAVFAEPALRESVQIIFDVNGHKFLANGRRTLEKGWMNFYGPYSAFDEIVLPELKKGDKLDAKSLEMLDKKTLPPPRYSQASIIKELEKKNLGTRATRSSILQTLYDRNYIIDRNIHVTDLGLKMAQVIKNYVPDFADEKLTRRFEKELEEIEQGKEKKEKVLDKAKIAVTKIYEEFKLNEDKIGKELGEAVIQVRDNQTTLGPCPKCGKDLKVMYSPKTKKYFCGCSGYPNCKYGMPLPHNATFQKTNRICDKCHTPIIMVYRRGKRPFKMCIDINCLTKSNWRKFKVSSNQQKSNNI